MLWGHNSHFVKSAFDSDLRVYSSIYNFSFLLCGSAVTLLTGLHIPGRFAGAVGDLYEELTPTEAAMVMGSIQSLTI